MNRIIWTPSQDSNIASYDIETAAVLAGPWSLLANVVHDLQGAGYDAAEGVFFHVHDAAPEVWYRLTAIDSGGQRSAPSTPFQALAFGGLSLASLADLRAYLAKKPTDTADDALLVRLLNAASEFFQQQTGRVIPLTSHVDVLDGDGGRVIVPMHYPVTEVESVKVGLVTVPEATDAEADGWTLANSVIRLRGAYRATAGLANVEARYTAGYAAVPADIQQAVIELAALKYRERSHVGSASQSMAGASVSFLPSIVPASVQAVIDSYRRPSF